MEHMNYVWDVDQTSGSNIGQTPGSNIGQTQVRTLVKHRFEHLSNTRVKHQMHQKQAPYTMIWSCRIEIIMYCHLLYIRERFPTLSFNKLCCRKDHIVSYLLGEIQQLP